METELIKEDIPKTLFQKGVSEKTIQRENFRMGLDSLTIPKTNSTYSNLKKKKRKEKKVSKRYTVNKMGVVMYKGSPGYGLCRSVQLGLQTAVKVMHSRPIRKLEKDDFLQKPKLQFPQSGTKLTPKHSYKNFEFKDFYPMAFKYIRYTYGIKDKDYLSSLCGNKAMTMLGTPGKSGALFFFSHDMRYMMKTVTKKEEKFLGKILKNYIKHIQNNPHTLITRFLGMHRIKPEGGKNVRFVVMNNVFYTDLKIHERYDLKGSTIGRYATEEEKEKETCILKDMDVNRHLNIGKEKTIELKKQMRSDVTFLEKHGIMDYSLLLGIHKIPPHARKFCPFPQKEESDSESDDDLEDEKVLQIQNGELPLTPISPTLKKIGKKGSMFQKDNGGCKDMKGDRILFFGIIDILQSYNTRKRVERTLKSIKYEKEGISVADPMFYGERFLNFMYQIFLYEDEDKKIESK